jgi:hypothetical protein
MASIYVAWPNFTSRTNNTVQTHAVNGSSHFEAVYMAQEGADITEIGWVLTSKTGTPVGQIRLGLQTVDNATGLATGTWIGGSSNYVTYGTDWSSISPGAFTAILPSSASLTRGQYYAVVFSVQTAFDTSNFITVTYSTSTINGQLTNIPYLNTTTTNKVARRPNIAIRSNTKTYGEPWIALTSEPIDNNSISGGFTEIGHYFSLPASMCATYKVCGIELRWTPNLSGNDFDIVLYEGTSRTALQRTTIYTDNSVAGSAGVGILYFDDTVTLNAGAEYRLMIQPNSTLTCGTVYLFEVEESQDMTAYLGTDATCYLTKWDGSAYTNVQTQFIGFNLLLDDITEPASSGGAYPIFGGMVIK